MFETHNANNEMSDLDEILFNLVCKGEGKTARIFLKNYLKAVSLGGSIN